MNMTYFYSNVKLFGTPIFSDFLLDIDPSAAEPNQSLSVIRQ